MFGGLLPSWRNTPERTWYVPSIAVLGAVTRDYAAAGPAHIAENRATKNDPCHWLCCERLTKKLDESLGVLPWWSCNGNDMVH